MIVPQIPRNGPVTEEDYNTYIEMLETALGRFEGHEVERAQVWQAFDQWIAAWGGDDGGKAADPYEMSDGLIKARQDTDMTGPSADADGGLPATEPEDMDMMADGPASAPAAEVEMGEAPATAPPAASQASGRPAGAPQWSGAAGAGARMRPSSGPGPVPRPPGANAPVNPIRRTGPGPLPRPSGASAPVTPVQMAGMSPMPYQPSQQSPLRRATGPG